MPSPASQEYIARKVREDDRPFGGMQVIFWYLGRLLPLNLVRKACRLRRLLSATSCPGKKLARSLRLRGGVVASLFWVSHHPPSSLPSGKPRCGRQHPTLVTLLSSLAEFIDMLNSIRRGIVTPEIAARMNQLSRDVVYPDGIEPADL